MMAFDSQRDEKTTATKIKFIPPPPPSGKENIAECKKVNSLSVSLSQLQLNSLVRKTISHYPLSHPCLRAFQFDILNQLGRKQNTWQAGTTGKN